MSSWSSPETWKLTTRRNAQSSQLRICKWKWWIKWIGRWLRRNRGTTFWIPGKIRIGNWGVKQARCQIIKEFKRRMKKMQSFNRIKKELFILNQEKCLKVKCRHNLIQSLMKKDWCLQIIMEFKKSKKKFLLNFLMSYHQF